MTTAAATTSAFTPRQEFIDGAREVLPIAIVPVIFGLAFGAASIKAGLDVAQTLFASATIFAGASQFVFIELHGQAISAWWVVLAVFAVNFRHILYSASLGRKMAAFSALKKYTAFFFMTDPTIGTAERRADTVGLRPAFYFGYNLFIYALWLVATAAGAWSGRLIEEPARFGLDFVLPVYFTVMVMGFRDRPNWLPVVLAAGITSTILFHLVGPPWHISLGAGAGIAAAVIIAKTPATREVDDG